MSTRNALGFIVFLIHLVAAPWAALGIGSVRWRIVVVLGVALLLGITLALNANSAIPFPEWRWWLISMQALTFLIPTIVMAASLLVVRSCGYRLVTEARGRNVPAVGTTGPAA